MVINNKELYYFYSLPSFQCIFLNNFKLPRSKFHPNVINDCLNAIFKACYDLVFIGHNVYLNFGFANVVFENRKLTFIIQDEVTEKINLEYEGYDNV